MVVVWREEMVVVYGEMGDDCCMERGGMVVVWRERRWLLYGERVDGCCMER